LDFLCEVIQIIFLPLLNTISGYSFHNMYEAYTD
jgi:hypothetical protein